MSIRAPWVILLALVGCAASAPEQRTGDKGFASADECGRAADHLFTIRLHGTSVDVPQEHLLNGSNLEYRRQYNDFVAACTTKWSRGDVGCVLAAPAFQYVRQCEITEGTTPLVTRRGERSRIPGDF
jgi:hypothetical protein